MWRRVRCAAILAGHRGPEALAQALDIDGVGFRTIWRTFHGEKTMITPALIAALIAEHCADRGVTVPAWWILHGFGEEPGASAPA